MGRGPSRRRMLKKWTSGQRPPRKKRFGRLSGRPNVVFALMPCRLVASAISWWVEAVGQFTSASEKATPSDSTPRPFFCSPCADYKARKRPEYCPRRLCRLGSSGSCDQYDFALCPGVGPHRRSCSGLLALTACRAGAAGAVVWCLALSVVPTDGLDTQDRSGIAPAVGRCDALDTELAYSLWGLSSPPRCKCSCTSFSALTAAQRVNKVLLVSARVSR